MSEPTRLQKVMIGPAARWIQEYTEGIEAQARRAALDEAIATVEQMERGDYRRDVIEALTKLRDGA